MKKIVSILLAAVLALGMTATVIAAGASQSGSTTVRTVVPSASYTMVVPATLDLVYGESAHLMETAITDVEGFDEGDMVWMNVSWTDLFSGNDSIPLSVLVSTYENGKLTAELENPREAEVQINQIAYMEGAKFSVEYYAFVTPEDWEAAVPGSYEGTVYFDSTYIAAQQPAE